MACRGRLWMRRCGPWPVSLLQDRPHVIMNDPEGNVFRVELSPDDGEPNSG
jgi:hypothetical protein